MLNYYVNKNAQPNGDHEVHREGCAWLPNIENRIHLGQFFSCQSAVLEAGKHYVQTDGCAHCSSACHTS